MNLKIKRYISVLFLSVFTLSWSIPSSVAADDSLVIKGSDTMVNLGQAWAEEFMAQYPDVLIAVTGGGSGTGIAALISGTTSIAQSSRKITEKESGQAAANGHKPVELSVAIDAIAVVVSPQNPISQLSIDQLSDIFSGKIENWKEVGGKDEPILALSRERNSGTHVYFLEDVVRRGNAKGPEEFAPSVLMMPSSQAIVQEISDNTGAIGYVGHGYLNASLKALGVAKTKDSAFVMPTIEAALDGSYALSRPLYFYLPSEPTGNVKAFIDFVLSEQGQKIVLDMDFIPLKKT